MTLAELQAQRDAILHLAAREGASNVRVYGPQAQGMDSDDVHLLVEMKRDDDILLIMDLSARLSGLLGCRVFVHTAQTLSQRTRARILREAVSLQPVP